MGDNPSAYLILDKKKVYENINYSKDMIVIPFGEPVVIEDFAGSSELRVRYTTGNHSSLTFKIKNEDLAIVTRYRKWGEEYRTELHKMFGKNTPGFRILTEHKLSNEIGLVDYTGKSKVVQSRE